MFEHRKKIITEKCENPMLFKWDFKKLGGPRKSYLLWSFMVENSFFSRILTIRGVGAQIFGLWEIRNTLMYMYIYNVHTYTRCPSTVPRFHKNGDKN